MQARKHGLKHVAFVIGQQNALGLRDGSKRAAGLRFRHLLPETAALPRPATFSLCCAVCEKMVVIIDLSTAAFGPCSNESGQPLLARPRGRRIVIKLVPGPATGRQLSHEGSKSHEHTHGTRAYFSELYKASGTKHIFL